MNCSPRIRHIQSTSHRLVFYSGTTVHELSVVSIKQPPNENDRIRWNLQQGNLVRSVEKFAVDLLLNTHSRVFRNDAPEQYSRYGRRFAKG